MTPIVSPCRTSGTPRVVRILPRASTSGSAYSGSAAMSPIWMMRPSSAAAPQGAAAIGNQRSLSQCGVEFGRERNRSDVSKHLALPDRKRPLRIAAKPRGRLEESVEHWLQVEGRTTDDPEHLACRGLVFERFLKVVGAVLQFVEQPRVLDRDHRLVGKGAHQLNLPLGEGLHPLPGKVKDANWLALTQQWDAERGAHFAERDHTWHSVFAVRHQIGDMDRLARLAHSPDYASPPWFEGDLPHGSFPLGREGEG